jgi:hypothetical protein
LMHGQHHPVYLIIDGHPSHRPKAVKEYLESLEDCLKLLFTTAVLPRVQPDELVWNDVKNNVVGRAKLESPQDLLHALLDRLRFLQARSHPQLLSGTRVRDRTRSRQYSSFRQRQVSGHPDRCRCPYEP